MRPGRPIQAAPILLALLAGPAGAAQEPSDPEPPRGFLGVTLEPVSDAMRAALSLEEGSGVMVRNILEGGAAEEAGLVEGDIILSVGGRPVRGPRDLVQAVGSHTPADRLEMQVWRDGRVVPLGAFLQARPEDGGPVAPPEARRTRQATNRPLGLTLMPLTDQLAAYFTAPGGALVARVAAGSAGEVAGVLAGDVIVAVDDQEVNGPAQLAALLRGAGGPHALLAVVRDGSDIFIRVPLE